MLNGENPQRYLNARNTSVVYENGEDAGIRVGRINTNFPLSPISGDEQDFKLSAREGQSATRSPYSTLQRSIVSLSLDGQHAQSTSSNLTNQLKSDSRSKHIPSSNRRRFEDTGWRLCYVICLYEFKSEDQDHLSFKQNEILEIVKQEDTGWWAALRDDKIGWVPSAFIQPIPDDIAEALRNIREEHRSAELELLSMSAPVPSHIARNSSSTSGSSDRYDGWHSADDAEAKAPFVQVISPTGLLSDDDSPALSSNLSPLSPSKLDSASQYVTSPPWLRKYPPSPTSPMPRPAPSEQVIPSPLPTQSISPLTTRSASPVTAARSHHHFLSRSRSESAPSLRAFRLRHKASRQGTLASDTQSQAPQEDPPGLDFAEDDGIPIPRTRTGKVKQLTGDDDAQAFHNAQKAQARLPWYLQPTYGEDVIKLEYDGSVRAGTLSALVERLTVDPLKLSQENYFRNSFLTTFRTFTTADVVFELLVERYQMDHPRQLTDEQFDEWKQRKLRPVQKRVLVIFTSWLEQHGLLEDDPHIAPRMKDFLSLIVSPDSLALTAKQTVEAIDRLMRARRNPVPIAITPSKKKKHKFHKNELLKMDPGDIAQHLTLYEHRLYVKIRPSECLHWAKQMKGNSAANLSAFCATHDQLATWVKMSILGNDGLGKRADMIDLWIKVAEKCRHLNNYSSMAAIVASLHSSMLERLYLTWAHVTRMNQLEPLARLTAPTANFMAHRTLYMTLEAPCVPFVGMYLTDLVHINDQLKDTITFPARPGSQSIPLINFIKRQKWYDAVKAILRYQSQGYVIPENPMLMQFVETHLGNGAGKDQAELWQRAQELQQTEVAHADFRRGLEAAGF